MMRARLIILMLITVFFALGLSGIAQAQQQSLCDLASVAPNQGPPGTMVLVSGSGSIQFDSLAVTVFWDDTLVATIPPDMAGNYSGSFNVPADAATGAHIVTVVVPPTQGPSEECPFPFTVTASVQQQAYPVAGTAALPRTGVMTLALPAAGLALGIMGSLAARRRRR